MSSENLLGPRPRGGLSQRSRLILGCVIAAGGGILTLVALQAGWQKLICPGELVNIPGGGSARVGGRVSAVSGAALAAWLVPLAVVAAFLPALALLVDRRPRAAILALVALVALVAIIGIFATPPRYARAELGLSGCRLVDTSSRNVAFIGGLLALGGVALAAKPATVVPKLGLPERPPSEVEP